MLKALGVTEFVDARSFCKWPRSPCNLAIEASHAASWLFKSICKNKHQLRENERGRERERERALDETALTS